MSKVVSIGNLKIGGGNKIAVQTMLDVKTSFVAEVKRKIEEVTALGCDIIRFSVKDESDALAIKEIKKFSKIPLVADIHFDYRLALSAIDNGVDKIRINPGNIGSEKNVSEVAMAIKQNGVAVRVGSNSGSVEKGALSKYGKTEVAIRAAFKAVMDSKQVAYLAPTTVLASQHFHSFMKRMKDYPIKIQVLSRLRSPKEQKDITLGFQL